METTALSRPCPSCRLPVGNVPKHLPACRRSQALAVRAAAHADELNTWDHGVTDLDIARLLRALDSGTLIHPTASMTQWTAPEGSPLRAPKRPLNATVNEALRVGLCRIAAELTGASTVRSRLAAAPVHARNPRRPLVPACLELLTVLSDRRFRMLDDLTLVDCQACIDRLGRQY